MADLKPCRWCGCKEVGESHYTSNEQFVFYVFCQECGVRMVAHDRLEARRRWNTRPTTQAEQLVEALEQAASWFDEYADHHAKLATAAGHHVGQERDAKAQRNKDRADHLRQALATYRSEGG